MSATLVIEEGNSPILQMVVRDALTGTYVNDASVQVTITDLADVQVAGQTWPLQLDYVPLSNGIYRGQLEDDVDMDIGLTYKATFAILVDTITRHVIQNIYVTAPTGDTPPATSVSSPAYLGPSLQTRLNEAELAFHRLMLGGTPTVVVDQNGERVEYAAGSINRLAAYIQSLKMQLGLVNGRPLRVYYS